MGRSSGSSRDSNFSTRSCSYEDIRGTIQYSTVQYLQDKLESLQKQNRAPECPICFDLMSPPGKIFQCGSGHFVCESCEPRVRLSGNCCPTCRMGLTGRATGMEQFLRS